MLISGKRYCIRILHTNECEKKKFLYCFRGSKQFFTVYEKCRCAGPMFLSIITPAAFITHVDVKNICLKMSDGN